VGSNRLYGKILRMHIDSDDHFKKACSMEVTEDYVIVDWKSIMATAEKWKKKAIVKLPR
jgi:hypothetical protein